MHGAHPFEGPTRLWWGDVQDGKPVTQPPGNTRNLFSPVGNGGAIAASQMFTAGGLIDGSGQIVNAEGKPDRTALHTVMTELATLLKEWPDPKEPTRDDPGIPAGYTYLLQFIAHDLVDSVFGVELTEGGLEPTRFNARARPLMLDTLYGRGPDEVPHAYAVDKLFGDDAGFVPRVRLRLGPRLPKQGITASHCPFRDLARGTPTLSNDDAVKPPAGPDEKPLLTEAFVADPRNDTHALVAQLTILFALLHNDVLSSLAHAPGGSEDQASGAQRQPVNRERTYREFLCARLAVTDIFRTIVFEDVLPKIVDWRVLERYRSGNKPLVGEGEGIPLEFTFGALRFGHAMVREEYKVNSNAPAQTDAALHLSSTRRPKAPINPAWLVDWQRFFFKPGDIDTVGGNFSRRLAPRYTAPLNSPENFAPETAELDTAGLLDRDLTASCYAGLVSVPALINKLAGVFGDVSFRPFEERPDEEPPPAQPAPPIFEAWRAKILERFAECLERSELLETLSPQLLALANDPPLPFFVLLEAQLGEGVDERTGKRAPIEGRHLGPIGSIIVAETFYGAAHAHPLTGDDGLRSFTLAERLEAYARSFFPASEDDPERPDRAAAALGPLIAADITSMPKLIAFLRERRQFGSAEDHQPG